MTKDTIAHQFFLDRCYGLATLAGKEVGSNPMVGAVLVHDGRVLSEAYYKNYGGDHAEVQTINNVKERDRRYIASSTLYISLEPCCIFGKTPPCTNAIITAGIKKVHIGTLDPFPGIAGNGITKLKEAGVEVTNHNCSKAISLIQPFSIFHTLNRPFITLKFAKSRDNFIGKRDEQVWLSGDITNVYTHKVRSKMDAILVGTNTAILDNPRLNTRNYNGPSPTRLVIDLYGRIPLTHNLLHDEFKTIVFTNEDRKLPSHKVQVMIQNVNQVLAEVLTYCHSKQILNLLVEGGGKLLNSFKKVGLWDRAIIINSQHVLGEGVKAPNIHGYLEQKLHFETDTVHIVSRQQKANL